MVTPDLSLAEVLEAMAEGVVVLDPERRIVLWNRAMAELTGWSSAERIGRTHHLIGCSAEEPGENSLESLHVECALPTRRGPLIPVLRNLRRTLDRGGNPCGWVLTFTDLRPLKRLQADLAAQRGPALSGIGPGRLIGGSPAMRAVYDRIELAADSEVTVLIQGETGTGKELVAEAIHQMGPRAQAPLLRVNCSALSEGLLESELFGHIRGAFTGAVSDKTGRVGAAEGGTLFLDEIGDISPRIQLKLLRLHDFPPELQTARARALECQPAAAATRSPGPEIIEETLRACQGNRSLAARRLGIDRSTLWRKLKKKERKQH